MKVRFLPLTWRRSMTGACALLTLAVAGCRQDMHNQPKMIPQRHSALFADGRSARQQVTGTVSREQALTASYLTTGLINGAEGNGMPFPVTQAVLERGQERYNIYCTPCHSRVGNGKGAIVARGYYSAGNFQSARLRQAPLGHFFWVMTHGYGAMPNYSVEIQPEDRWAIVAYIRALQLSQQAQRSDVPAGITVAHMHNLLEDGGHAKNFLGEWDSSAEPDDSADPAPVATQPAPTPTTTTQQANAKTPEPTTKATPTQEKIATVAGKTSGKSLAAGATPVPAKTVAKGDATHGHELYMGNCAVCHQPTRAGLPPIFPSLLGIVEKDGEAKVRKVAKEGIPDAKPPMPPHPNLTEDDLNDLIAFLRTK